MPNDKTSFWRDWINPGPMSRKWWIVWLTSLVFFGALMFGAVLYVHFTTGGSQAIPSTDTSSESAPQ